LTEKHEKTPKTLCVMPLIVTQRTEVFNKLFIKTRKYRVAGFLVREKAAKHGKKG